MNIRVLILMIAAGLLSFSSAHAEQEQQGEMTAYGSLVNYDLGDTKIDLNKAKADSFKGKAAGVFGHYHVYQNFVLGGGFDWANIDDYDWKAGTTQRDQEKNLQKDMEAALNKSQVMLTAGAALMNNLDVKSGSGTYVLATGSYGWPIQSDDNNSGGDDEEILDQLKKGDLHVSVSGHMAVAPNVVLGAMATAMMNVGDLMKDDNNGSSNSNDKKDVGMKLVGHAAYAVGDMGEVGAAYSWTKTTVAGTGDRTTSNPNGNGLAKDTEVTHPRMSVFYRMRF